MANAFDFTNMAMLALLTYAREAYSEDLTLVQLADTIEEDAGSFFTENEVGEQDQMLAEHSATAMAAMLRSIGENGYTVDDYIDAISNVIPEESFDDVEEDSESDDEEDDEEDEDDSDDESDEDDEEDDEDDEDELDDDEDEEDDEEELEELDDEEDDEDEDDEEDEDLDEDDLDEDEL